MEKCHRRMFSKAVSDTVFDMINAVYHDKPLILIGATFREKLISNHQIVNINCFKLVNTIKLINKLE